MSFFARLRRLRFPRPGQRWRRVAAPVTTVLAALLVLLALVFPNDLTRATPGAFLRVPVEALLGAVLLVLLPPRARKVTALLAGLTLGLLTIVKFADIGFYAVLARPFDPVLDWSFLRPGVEFVAESFGWPAAIGLVIGAVATAAVTLILLTRSVLRLTRLMVRHDTRTIRLVAVLAIACVAFSALGVRVVPEVSAAGLAYDRLVGVPAAVTDQRDFAAAAAVDAFRDTPGDQLLTALRGKDVVVTFIESYGRSAVEDPRYAPEVGALLADGDRRLSAAGYTARSGYLTSPTAGGGSWLAHATLLSGLWINNPQRYGSLVDSDRLTLNSAFQRANWRTVGVMPGIIRDWPEGEFYRYDQFYDSRDFGYRGPRFSFGTIPDQYTLSTFDRLEYNMAGRPPLMAEIALISSHGPWAPIPKPVDWDTIGNGAVFSTQDADDPPKAVLRDPERMRTHYRMSIQYSVDTVISYLERHAGEALLMVLLGDHQPAPMVAGAGASHDVPITIIARDPAVFDRISDWGWTAGLKPAPQAPVWPMDAFRDRFLTAFSPGATGQAGQAAPR